MGDRRDRGREGQAKSVYQDYYRVYRDLYPALKENFAGVGAISARHV
jgi:hypothetical protein